MKSPSLTIVFITSIICLGFTLRILGLNAGLPIILNLDEYTIIDNSFNLSLQDLNPHVFMYGNLPFYINRAWIEGFSFFRSGLIGGNPTSADIFLYGRFLSVILSTFTIFTSFLFVKNIAGINTGIIAAALVAFSPTAINLAHYTTVDAAMTFFSSLAFLKMAEYQPGRINKLIFAALWAGLATSTKYNSALLFLPILVLGILSPLDPTKERNKYPQIIFGLLSMIGLCFFLSVILMKHEILMEVGKWTTNGVIQPEYQSIFHKLVFGGIILSSTGMIIALLSIFRIKSAQWIIDHILRSEVILPLSVGIFAFFITSPYTIIDFPHFTRDIFFQLNKNNQGGILSLGKDSRIYQAYINSPISIDHFAYIRGLTNEWGILLFLGMFIGVGVLWVKNRSLFHAFVPVTLLTIISSLTWRYVALRYLFMLWPLFILFSALSIDFAIKQIGIFLNLRSVSIAAQASVLAFLIIPLFMKGYLTTKTNFLNPDTREQAFAWIEQHVPADFKIIQDVNFPFFERVRPDYNVTYSIKIFEDDSLDTWREKGVSYFILSQDRMDLYLNNANHFQDVLSEYNQLANSWILERTFFPGPNVNGPTIYIYSKGQ